MKKMNAWIGLIIGGTVGGGRLLTSSPNIQELTLVLGILFGTIAALHFIFQVFGGEEYRQSVTNFLLGLAAGFFVVDSIGQYIIK